MNFEAKFPKEDEEKGKKCNGVKPKNPLLNELIVRELMEYLSEAGTELTGRFKDFRLVCYLWKEIISEDFYHHPPSITIGEIDTDPSRLIQHYSATIQNFKRISNISLSINNSEWLKHSGFLLWINFFKSKLISIKISKVDLKFSHLFELLGKCPNLEELTLDEVTAEDIPDLDEVTGYEDACSESVPGFNFKHFTTICSAFSILERPNSGAMLAAHLMLRIPPLESLKVHFIKEEYNPICFLCQRSFSMKTAGVWKKLKRLELRSLWLPYHYKILNYSTGRFEGLRELLIEMDNCSSLDNLLPFFQCLAEQLEKFELILRVVTRTTMRSNNGVLLFPVMEKIKDFSLFYKLQGSRDLILGSIPLPNNWSVGVLIKCFPVLESLIVGECSWYEGPLRGQIQKGCDEGICKHVEQLLGNEDGETTPLVRVEKLKCFCAFGEGFGMGVVAKFFPNIRILWVWIDSRGLNECFGVFKRLKGVEFLTVELSRTVEDLPLAFNSNLPGFLRLKELTLEKVAKGWKSGWEWGKVKLEHLDDIALGITECEPLKILSFKNLTVDRMEIERLKSKILEKKPNLALNIVNIV